MKYAQFDADGVLLARRDSAVHGPMPDSGFVELSEEMFVRTIQETDGQWRLTADGVLEKFDFTMTSEQIIAAERVWRDEQVDATEWLVTRHRDEQYMQLPTTLTAEQFAELLAYRQALRDWPQTEVFPDPTQRPVAPPWLAEQTQ